MAAYKEADANFAKMEVDSDQDHLASEKASDKLLNAAAMGKNEY